jgi:hypothetical protein
MAVALDTSPEALARMRRNVETIDRPVEFCRRYLRLRGFHTRARDYDDLLAIAVESLIKAGLHWTPRDGTGVAFTTMAYRYMDREVLRELARDQRRPQLIDDWSKIADFGRYDPSTGPYRQIEDRDEIADLMDRANLSQPQRFALWFSAVHASDGPPPKGHEPLGSVASSTDHKTGIRRIRKVIAGDTLNDDWAAARAEFRAGFEIRAHQSRQRYLARQQQEAS